MCKAAKVPVESYWPPIFAKFFSSKDIGDIISNVGAGGGGGAVVAAGDAGAGAAGGGGVETAKEEEKEEEKEESEEDEVNELLDVDIKCFYYDNRIWDSACLIKFNHYITLIMYMMMLKWPLCFYFGVIPILSFKIYKYML